MRCVESLEFDSTPPSVGVASDLEEPSVDVFSPLEGEHHLGEEDAVRDDDDVMPVLIGWELGRGDEMRREEMSQNEIGTCSHVVEGLRSFCDLERSVLLPSVVRLR